MWLLSSEALVRVEHIMSSGLTLTAHQQTEIVAASNGVDIMTVAGTTARIEVNGILTESPDIMARIFGGGNTTYSDIISALAAADSNPEIDNVEMLVNSPGGSVDGLFDALAALQVFSKPLTAIVGNNAESAAYAIVSQADTIA